MKLIMVDLDGTLFDTTQVNYLAYRDAMHLFGYELDREYYRRYCNGKYYLDFLPKLTTNDTEVLSKIHAEKKRRYREYLRSARPNKALIELLEACGERCKRALVTTASRNNALELLEAFGLTACFDLILTGDEIKKNKPDPEGYLRAMAFFEVETEDCVIFEDSEAGLEAAKRAGVTCFAAVGFN